jgi:SAM-dependent methyltransferase
LKGYEVIAVEPDSSETVGCGAITIQKEKLNLVQLNVLKEYGEKISLADECCDVVYVRQAMHHASNLDNFMREASRILKKGGLFLGIREHVVYDAKDRLRFLESHPLQKYYGGENAYTENEYLNAINKAGLILKHVYKYFDTVINYYPVKSENLSLKIQLNKKIGRLSDYRVFQNLYKKIWELRYGKFLDERRIAGRMYSFVCVKPHKN